MSRFLKFIIPGHRSHHSQVIDEKKVLKKQRYDAEVQRILDDNCTVVFSKSWCKVCDSVKARLRQQNIHYHVVEIDRRRDGRQIQKALIRRTKQRTVPVVFISRKFRTVTEVKRLGDTI